MDSFDGVVYLNVLHVESGKNQTYRFNVKSFDNTEWSFGFMNSRVMALNKWDIDELDKNINGILAAASECRDANDGFSYISKYFDYFE